MVDWKLRVVPRWFPQVRVEGRQAVALLARQAQRGRQPESLGQPAMQGAADSPVAYLMRSLLPGWSTARLTEKGKRTWRD